MSPAIYLSLYTDYEEAGKGGETNLKDNGNTFYPIIKLFTTWILRKRLANWTCHHNNIGILSIYLLRLD